MSLIRIKKDVSLRAWDKEEPDFQEIMKKWFEDPPDEQPSLYEALTPLEEIDAVAALSITDLPPGIKERYLVRIEWDDLLAVGIQASNGRPGNTGVAAVDFRHWEIAGDRGPILDLMRHIWKRALRGEDRFRMVGEQMQAAAMKQFLGSDPRVVIEEAKRCCRHKLKKQPNGRRPLGPAIQDELRTNPPTIPEGRIMSLAGEKWLQRLRAGAAGNAEQDWLSAERELRQRYEQELLAYTLPHARGAPH